MKQQQNNNWGKPSDSINQKKQWLLCLLSHDYCITEGQQGRQLSGNFNKKEKKELVKTDFCNSPWL